MLARIRDLIYFVTDVMSIKIFLAHHCYIVPVFIMFASTFKVLTGLSLAIVLARFFLHGEERRDASPGNHSMKIAASRR